MSSKNCATERLVALSVDDLALWEHFIRELMEDEQDPPDQRLDPDVKEWLGKLRAKLLGALVAGETVVGDRPNNPLAISCAIYGCQFDNLRLETGKTAPLCEVPREGNEPGQPPVKPVEQP